jgi:hypothetical protein
MHWIGLLYQVVNIRSQFTPRVSLCESIPIAIDNLHGMSETSVFDSHTLVQHAVVEIEKDKIYGSVVGLCNYVIHGLHSQKCIETQIYHFNIVCLHQKWGTMAMLLYNHALLVWQ